MSAAAIALSLSTTAFAQPTDTQNGADATNIINFSMTLETGLTLTIDGDADDSDNTTLSSVSGNEGTVDFGSVNTVSDTSTQGGQFRVGSGTTGAHFVATLTAGVTFGGGADASLGMERETAAGGAGDVPDGQLRFALGTSETWSTATAGTAVPDATAGAGDELSSSITTGNPVTFQISSFLADADDAGSYDTAIVFTASPN